MCDHGYHPHKVQAYSRSNCVSGLIRWIYCCRG
ncbi:hypothetical protein YPPY91_1454, partial [Yersinia pestis PY-91]